MNRNITRSFRENLSLHEHSRAKTQKNRKRGYKAVNLQHAQNVGEKFHFISARKKVTHSEFKNIS